MQLVRRVEDRLPRPYAYDLGSAVNRVFEVLERVALMDPQKLTEAIEDAGRAAEADWPGAIAAELFADVASGWQRFTSEVLRQECR